MDFLQIVTYAFRQFKFRVVELVHLDGGEHVRVGGGQSQGGADEGQELRPPRVLRGGTPQQGWCLADLQHYFLPFESFCIK